MSAPVAFRQWMKTSPHPVARGAWRAAKRLRSAQFPFIRPIHLPLYHLHHAVLGALRAVGRAAYSTPLFQARLVRPAPRLYLYGGMPQVLGQLDLSIGADCRISGHTTFAGRPSSKPTPCLVIGNNVGIGWQTTITVGTRVVIGNNVRIAGRALLSGFPGHPIDARARAAGLPDEDHQSGEIVLEDDVWLATGVTVSAGVTIGRGTIVAAGSVVTKDLPANVLAAGVPARALRSLN